ncbi:helix-turn-helix domain-containing protein [Paenarthrobacter nicotinovorans]|uniref:helix-turn-helix domain-containing protein n=1 Tax=Paenarthrobacter nicotinovorans TaxID=29320 RepID=UPI003805ECF2
MSKAPKSYSFEVKLTLVQRFLAGETGPELAIEAGLSSRQLLQKWVRAYRVEGEDGLRPKRDGKPIRTKTTPSAESGARPSRKPATGRAVPQDAELSELEQLRRENELLRAEVAYLGKLRALRAQERR